MTGPAASRRDWPETIHSAVAAGVDWVQVRDRSLPAAELLAFTRMIRTAARQGAQARGVPVLVLVNRRADVALCAPADGLHLGFDALPLTEARRLFSSLAEPSLSSLAEPALVGMATHSAEEASAAAEAGADYAHLAPIFDPLSKPAERPPLGLAGLARAAAGVAGRRGFRLLAQGGIDAETVESALRAGADGIAVTGAVLGATHPGDAAAQLRATLDRTR